MDLKLLWKQRRTGFWNGILPYLGYVIQSGVAMVFLFLVIAFSAWYTSFVQNIPADFPIRWIALLLLSPLVLFSSYRTYLLPADIVFLRPQEYRMQEYLKNSFARGIIYKALGLLLVFVTLWPLYVRADLDARPFGWFVLFLLLWKGLSSYGAWQELRMVQVGATRAYRLLRWTLTVLAIGAWLWQPPLRSVWFLLLLAAVYIVALRVPVKHRVAWERLIQVEQGQAGRVMRTLGWFVDVPSSGQKVSSRRWLAKLGSGLPWNAGKAYRYLITKTYIRTEVFSIVLRLVILGMLLSWWTAGSYFGIGVYLFFLLLAGVQLGALRRSHSESFWIMIYPISGESRRSQVLGFIFHLHALVALFMWLPMLAAGVNGLSLTGLGLVLGILVIVLMRRSQGNKWLKEEQDE
ncbi:ABC transporter permease [Paenibacillus sp. PCH8]|uniref:ABC transporter permease n=1 Tax=Paenibacillus sp. PCH8 TaxID=2066524 RepID=UPI000CF88A49|nr:ABC transporter permease [Paenibacillus sp. PCH8]PQP80905.1 ABC transporter permease [Paenibacillus sp. PCH8]